MLKLVRNINILMLFSLSHQSNIYRTSKMASYTPFVVGITGKAIIDHSYDGVVGTNCVHKSRLA